MTAEQKIKYLPAGGIAGFVMSNEDINKLEAEELQEQYGTTGIAQFSTIGKNMANFGRHGDDTVAHVETGELIVPRALIENNPELKESIFDHLRELGVEDPERYVVGESNNSLNPTTGLPEFFFKKLFRSVSKVVKSVGKILKKAAPIIIPIALNFIAPGLGAIWSGAIGSGITTLVQGGSIKDAFKSALIGGATGALAAGFSGPKSGIGGFMDNISADVTMGTQNISDAFSQGSFSPLQNTNIPSIRNYDANPANDTGLGTEASNSNFNPDGTVKVTELSGANTDLNLGPSADGSVQVAGDNLYPELQASSTNANAYRVGDSGKFVSGDVPVPQSNAGIDVGKPDPNIIKYNPNSNPAANLNASYTAGIDETVNVGAGTTTGSGSSNMYDTLKEYGTDAKNYLTQGGNTDAQIIKMKQDAYKAQMQLTGNKDLAIADYNAAGPGIIAKYGPSVALAGLASYAGGAYDVPEPESEEEEDVRTGMNAYNENPERFRLGDLDLRYIEGDPRVASKYPFYRPRNVQRAAQGGQIFPRRVGGIMPNEGIPNKDSVRAMLMPGEFVMTTDAVKGLGGGDMNKGINNMYGVMRNLEQRGRRA